MSNFVWRRTEPGRAPEFFAEDVAPGKFGRKFDYWMTRAVWEKLDIDTPEGSFAFLATQYEPVASVDDDTGLTSYVHEDVAYYAKPVRVLHFPKGEDKPREVTGHCVDGLFAIDDGRFVGFNVWSTPEFARASIKRDMQAAIDRLERELQDAVARPLSDKVNIVVTDAILDEAARKGYAKYEQLIDSEATHMQQILREVIKEAVSGMPGIMYVESTRK